MIQNYIFTALSNNIFWPHRSFACFNILNSSYIWCLRVNLNRIIRYIDGPKLQNQYNIQIYINVKEKYMRRTLLPSLWTNILVHLYIGVPRQMRHELSSRYRTRRYIYIYCFKTCVRFIHYVTYIIEFMCLHNCIVF